jgi:transketolase
MAKASRQAFGEALLEVGRENPNVVALDADLAKSTMTKLFAQEFPDRFFDFGIAESNMIGAAVGMALSGKIPFLASFACFLTGRYETIRISAAYSKAPIHLVGTHCGIGIGEDGNSQMGLEDLTIMRALPNMSVLQPGDEIETKQAIRYLVGHRSGPTYIRLTRQKLQDVNGPDYRFEFGKGVVLRDGKDLTLVATGGVVYNALEAAEKLATDGLDVRVVNIHTIKPIDTELLGRCAEETGAVFTVEDHNIIGGLGGAVCEAIAERHPVPVKRWGLPDCFGESGSPEGLYEKYRFDVSGIAANVREFAHRLGRI